ncbi:MAG TPA: hypothetical protein VGQ21_21900 [Thermoanaerobaculia bacterium]|jgi:hypothetical protein|nr:hypothetical protein [Thermoanaerobaculia bacterium]
MSEQVIRLAPGQTAVVGYGSLLSMLSISRTLSRDYGGPFVPCHVDGWRRSWDVAMPNEAFYYLDGGARIYPKKIVYLNVGRSPRTLLNAMLFVVDDTELQAMHGREWIYDPVSVASDLRGVKIEGGDAIMYAARDRFLVRGASQRREAAIRVTYVKILRQALDNVTPDFREEYERSTDPIPADLVIDDTLDPARPSPWAGSGYEPERQIEE